MARFQESIEVQAPIAACYEQWLRFEEFPQFMEYVKSVTRHGDSGFHWVVSGPLGKDLEWDAEIDGNDPNKLISWHSVSEPDVGIQGAVLFEVIDPNTTRIVSTMQYEPPGGPIGTLVAQIFSNPSNMVKSDLNNFRKLMENRAEAYHNERHY